MIAHKPFIDPPLLSGDLPPALPVFFGEDILFDAVDLEDAELNESYFPSFSFYW